MIVNFNSDIGSFQYDTSQKTPSSPVMQTVLAFVQPEISIPDLNIDYAPYGKPIVNKLPEIKIVMVFLSIVYIIGIYTIIHNIFFK